MSENIVIVGAARSAIGSFGGSLAGIPGHQLGASIIKGLLERTGVGPEQVDEVILGQVLTAGTGQNPARQAAIAAGLPVETSALTINKVCGSGLKAVHLARMFHPFLNLAGDMAKLGWFALTGNQTS
ncbi:MAG: hypothetical protein ABW161_14880, partial [Candidatus Thiodiazotropha sp.]